MKVVGVISDTHGDVPDAALDVLRGNYSPSQVAERMEFDEPEGGKNGTDLFTPAPVSRIVHAGDIGAHWILDVLSDIAPLTAVLGNCDYPEYYVGSAKVGPWERFEECGVSFAVLHKPEDLAAAINGAGPIVPAYIKPAPRVRIHGHTHTPKLQLVGDGVLVCPGSVSRPSGRMLDTSGWFKSLALVHVEEGGRLLGAEIVRI